MTDSPETGAADVCAQAPSQNAAPLAHPDVDAEHEISEPVVPLDQVPARRDRRGTPVLFAKEPGR